MRYVSIRIALAVAGVYGVLTGILPITLMSVIAAALLYSGVEAVALAVAFDLMWSPAPYASVPWMTLAVLAMLWASEPIRREILR